MRSTAPTLLRLASALLLLVAGSPGQTANTGIGVGFPPYPRPFEWSDFDSIPNGPGELTGRSLHPGAAQALGFCKSPSGDGAAEFSIGLSVSWVEDETLEPGQMQHFEFHIRASSTLFVGKSPRIELHLVGSNGFTGEIELEQDAYLAGGPIPWEVPDLPPGFYRLQFTEEYTGVCGTADATFLIAGGSGEETPTPTLTLDVSPTPTPTASPTSEAPDLTATPTVTPSPTATTEGPPGDLVLNDTGPGTAPDSVRPALFQLTDFDSIRESVKPIASTVSPAILETLPSTKPESGKPPRTRFDQSIRVFTPEDLSIPWKPGEVHEIQIQARFSSLDLALNPPVLDLLLVGPQGSYWIDFGRRIHVSDDPLFWMIPELPGGCYQIYAVDRDTMQRNQSDLVFLIEQAGGPDRMPDYNEDDLVDGTDLPTFLSGLEAMNPEMDLDDDGNHNYVDLLQFARWWRRTSVNPPPD